MTKSREQRDILKDFFGILKNASKNIRFLLLTGVSKFSRTSIFSELNHLSDLTLDFKYAALCGYTQAELQHYFDAYLKTMPPNTLERMKLWYDGYSWDGQTFMYCPSSVMNFFDNKLYRSFWFESSTPTFLRKLMWKRYTYNLEEVEVSHEALDSLSLDKFDESNIYAALFHAGYLTIKEMTNDNKYILHAPNEEVRRSYQLFLPNYSAIIRQSSYFSV